MLDWNFIGPFVPNAPFLYPLKTSENHTVFWCFQWLEKGCIENQWVKKDSAKNYFLVILKKSSKHYPRKHLWTTAFEFWKSICSIKSVWLVFNLQLLKILWMKIISCRQKSVPIIIFRYRLQISLLILTEFKRIIFYSPEIIRKL